MRLAGHVARTGKKKNTCRILVGKPEVKTSPGRRNRRNEDNIKMNIKYIKWECVEWINLAQD